MSIDKSEELVFLDDKAQWKLLRVFTLHHGALSYWLDVKRNQTPKPNSYS